MEALLQDLHCIEALLQDLQRFTLQCMQTPSCRKSSKQKHFFCNAQPQVLLGLYRFLLPVQLREANCSSLAALRALSLEDAQNILVGP
jgi:hypothetical protein